MDGVAPQTRRAGPRWGERTGWAIPALVLVPVLVFASVAVGLRFPGGGDADASALAPLDYSRGPAGTVSPLRDSFIADVLGGVIGRPGSSGGGASVPNGGPAGPFTAPPTPVVDHALTNDDMAQAYRVQQLPFTGRTSTAGATREPDEPASCSQVGDTIWYRFRVTRTMGLIADTAGSERPVWLALFEGERPQDFSSADEWCASHPRGNARIPFTAHPGFVYHFQISSLSAGTVLFTLREQGSTERFLPELTDRADNILLPAAAPSADGRYIAYAGVIPSAQDEPCVGGLSYFSLAPEEVCRIQGFLYDRTTRRSVMHSVDPQGRPANDMSVFGVPSADGRWVGGASWATNLVEGDKNTCPRWYLIEGSCLDLFVRDRDADRDGIFDETHPGATKMVLVTVDSDGNQANGSAGPGQGTPDGRVLAFQSWADNLVPDDTNGIADVFAHDRDADEDGIFDERHPGAIRTWRISVSSSGEQAEVDPLKGTDPGALLDRRDHIPIERSNVFMGGSFNGRYVTFRSAAINLDPRCTSGAHHLYIHDIFRGTTRCVDLSSDGLQGNRGVRLHNNFVPKVSDDGRYVVFNSDATNLVPGDTNDAEDLFVRDLLLGTTERVTVTWDGKQAEGEGRATGRDAIFGVALTYGSVLAWEDVYTMSELNHAMTSDGRYVFFSSGADNLVPGDTNEVRDIFVRDLWLGTTTRVSVSTSGVQGEASSNEPIISADGSVLAFYSLSDDLDDRRQPGSLPGSPWYVYIRTFSGGKP